MLLFISLLWNTSAQRGNSTKMLQYCVFPLLPLFHISSGMVYSRRGENPCDAAWRMWVTVGQISRYLTSSPFVMDNLGPVQHVAIWLIWFTLRETGGGKHQEFPGEWKTWFILCKRKILSEFGRSASDTADLWMKGWVCAFSCYCQCRCDSNCFTSSCL